MFGLHKVPSSSVKAHRILLLVTFLYIFINITIPTFRYESALLSVGLFIFYTWRRILTIIIFAAVACILVGIFPFLAPVAFILMVIIFLARIQYIIRNWRAVLAGFYMYALAFGFAIGGLFVGPEISELFSWLYYLFYQVFPYPYYLLAGLIVSNGLVALGVTWTFHEVILWLYRHHYSLREALPIMGVAPLLIALIFLPFLKAIDVVDGSFSGDAVDGHDVAGEPVHTEGAPGEAVPGEAVRGGDGIHSPGTHYTHGYLRTSADGDVHYVRGYEATNPDGIVENNYSAQGISAVKGEPISYEPDLPPTHIEGNIPEEAPFIIDKKDKEEKK